MILRSRKSKRKSNQFIICRFIGLQYGPEVSVIITETGIHFSSARKFFSDLYNKLYYANSNLKKVQLHSETCQIEEKK